MQWTEEITSIAPSGETTARIAFQRAASATTPAGGAPQEASSRVADKSYVVTRGNRGKLLIRGERGAEPSVEEQLVVSNAVESLGNDNPLASRLHGKTMVLGESVCVPVDVVAEAYNSFREGRLPGYCSPDVVELTLREITTIDGVEVALFDAELEVRPSGLVQLLQASGRLAVETKTCRLRAAELAGPISIAQDSELLTHRDDGTLRVAMRSKHSTR